MLYSHAGRINVRYYDRNGYLDHGRMIYETIPAKGDIVHPFMGKNGQCNWRVFDVKMPENDSCFEIYVDVLD